MRSWLLWALGIGWAVSLAASVLAAPAVPSPSVEAARGGSCVEDPAVMRRKHMDYLNHQRDETVHGGVRGAKYSLKTCIDCHASKVSNSVTAQAGNFCISCHTYAAVKIDCFECHASHPAKPTAATSAIKPAIALGLSSALLPASSQRVPHILPSKP